MPRDAKLTAVPKRIGGSLAIFLPADFVKRGGIREGVPVGIVLSPDTGHKVLGLLKRGGRHRPFDRHSEGFWPDD